MFKLPFLTCLFYALISAQWLVFGQPVTPTISFNAQEPKQSIGNQVLVLRDPTLRLTLSDVQLGAARLRFKKSTQLAPNFGTTNDDAWACFRLENKLSGPQKPVLEVGFTNYDCIELYLVGAKGGTRKLVVGDRVNGHSIRDLPGQTFAIRLPLQAGESATIYLHLHTTIGQQYFPLTLWHENAYLQSVSDANILWGGYYGMFLLVILYHLFVYTTTREASYGYLLGYLLLYAFWELGRGNNLFLRFDLQQNWVISKLMPISYMASFLLLTLFYERMLQVRRYLPFYSYLMAGVATLLIGGILAVWFLPNAPKNLILMGTIWPTGLIIMLTSGYAYLQQPHIARFYTLAITVLWAGCTAFVLQRTGFLETEFWMIKYGVNVSSMFEFIFLTLGLADSVRHERYERRLLREESIRQQVRSEAEREHARIQGQLIERQRIGYELHNNLSGNLYGLRLLLKRIQPASPTADQQEVYQILTNSLKQTHETIRLISHNLIANQLSQQGLSALLNRLVMDLNQLGTTNFAIHLVGPVDTVPPPLPFELHTILLELCQNVLRHAEAESASIRVEASETAVRLQVSDDGRGIDPLLTSGGLGLQTMRERIAALNGTFQVENQFEGGTRIQLTLPFESANAVPISKVNQPDHRLHPHFSHEVSSVRFNGVFTNK